MLTGSSNQIGKGKSKESKFHFRPSAGGLDGAERGAVGVANPLSEEGTTFCISASARERGIPPHYGEGFGAAKLSRNSPRTHKLKKFYDVL